MRTGIAGSSGRFTEMRLTGKLTTKEKRGVHEHKVVAGRVYVIDLESTQFNTFLKLEDVNGKLLSQNDDVSADNLNSRLVVRAPKTEVIHVVATSFLEAGIGTYTLTIRDFKAAKSSGPNWDDIRSGKTQPKDAAESIFFAGQATKKRHYAMAARFYRKTFELEPALADNLDLGHRYNAACCAVVAAAGKGDDAADLTAEQTVQMRKRRSGGFKPTWRSGRSAWPTARKRIARRPGKSSGFGKVTPT